MRYSFNIEVSQETKASKQSKESFHVVLFITMQEVFGVLQDGLV